LLLCVSYHTVVNRAAVEPLLKTQTGVRLQKAWIRKFLAELVDTLFSPFDYYVYKRIDEMPHSQAATRSTKIV